MTDTKTQETIVLDTPLKRGDTEIASVTVTKPNAGALRGVTLVALANMDVVALQTVIPRVTQPSISSAEVATLDPADLVSLGSAIGSFLLTRADRAAFRPS
jgi:hypothetical protein